MIDTYEAGVDLGAECRPALLAVQAVATGNVKGHNNTVTLLEQLYELISVAHEM